MTRRTVRHNPRMPSLKPFQRLDFDDDFPRIPIEVYPKQERLTGRSMEILPGVKLLEQKSITDVSRWVTFCEGREIIVLADTEGRSSYVYRSFAGTQGKIQGYWYPIGGTFAHNGKNIWIIKSGIRKVRGMGRSLLTKFIDHVNDFLPHTDDETDKWLESHFGLINPGWALSQDLETKPTFNLIGKQPREVVEKWKLWATETWKLIGLNPVWGERDMANPGPRQNPSSKLEEGQVVSAYAQPGHSDFYGWKLHLGARPAHHRLIYDYLLSLSSKHPIGWKYGRSSGQEGKDFTIYVGPKRLADKIAVQIERDIGYLLSDEEVLYLPLEGNHLFTKHISGRYDIQTFPTAARQKNLYLYRTVLGVPLHEFAANNVFVVWNQPSKQEKQFWILYSDRLVAEEFGDHYHGGNEDWLLNLMANNNDRPLLTDFRHSMSTNEFMTRFQPT